MNYVNQSLVDQLEAKIRQGKTSEVSVILGRLQKSKIPRQQALPLANIARRIQCFKIAFLILSPIVDPKKLIGVKASPEELVEYGVCLSRIGAQSEALRVFNLVNGEDVPEVWLYQSLTSFTQWDYESAIPLLLKYVNSANIDGYQRLVGKVNLAEAYVVEGSLDLAQELLDDILSETKKENYGLMSSYAMGLLAQTYILLKKTKTAVNILDKALLLTESSSVYQLFLNKSLAIAKKSVDGLLKVKKEAVKVGHWETVRDCDFHCAIFTSDKHRFLYTYFGTPLAKYRDKMKHIFGKDLEIPPSYIRKLGKSSSKSKDRLILGEGHDIRSDAMLKPGQSLHRVLTYLNRDFYRPLSMGRLFSLLYPEEHFNYSSAPKRVYRVIGRLNDWFIINKIPLYICSTANGYEMACTKAYGIEISQDNGEQILNSLKAFMNRLRKANLISSFSSGEAVKKLGMARRSVNRLLNEAVTAGQLKQLGKGSETRYYVSN